MEIQMDVPAPVPDPSAALPLTGDTPEMRQPRSGPHSAEKSMSGSSGADSARDLFSRMRKETSDASRSMMLRWSRGVGLRPVTEIRTPAPGGTARLKTELQVGERARFLELIRRVEEAPCEAFIDELIDRGVSAERILRDLVTPVARTMGEEWTEDRCTFVDVTIVTGRLQRIVRSLVQRDPMEAEPVSAEAPTVLVASLPRQQHTLGLLVVAEFFRRARWQVAVGPPVGPAPSADVVAGRHVDVLALSLPLIELVPAARKEIRKLRVASQNRSLGVVVGGPVLLTNPGLVDDIEADACASEAHLAPEVARAFL